MAELVRKTATAHYYVRKSSCFKVSVLHKIISFPKKSYLEKHDSKLHVKGAQVMQRRES